MGGLSQALTGVKSKVRRLHPSICCATPQVKLPSESDLRLAFYCDKEEAGKKKEKAGSQNVYLEKVPAVCIITLGEGGSVNCG